MTAPPTAIQYKLDKRTLGIIHLNAITRIYGDHGLEVRCHSSYGSQPPSRGVVSSLQLFGLTASMRSVQAITQEAHSQLLLSHLLIGAGAAAQEPGRRHPRHPPPPQAEGPRVAQGQAGPQQDVEGGQSQTHCIKHTRADLRICLSSAASMWPCSRLSDCL